MSLRTYEPTGRGGQRGLANETWLGLRDSRSWSSGAVRCFQNVVTARPGKAGASLTCALQSMGSAWAELISSIFLQETLNF